MALRTWFGAAMAVAVVCVALAAPNGTAAPNGAAVAEEAVRTLEGEELKAASLAMDAARQLRERFWAACDKGGATSAEATAAYENVLAAYKAIAEKYSGTEIGARALICMVGLYLQRGDAPQANQTMEAITARFAGTKFVTEAYFSAGAEYLQRAHDPQMALMWLERIDLPAVTAPPDDADREEKMKYAHEHQLARKQYTSVLQLMARCDVELGRPRDAARRYDKLIQLFPEGKEEAERSLEFAVRSILSNREKKDLWPVMQAWLEEHQKARAAEEDARWGQTVAGLRCAIEILPRDLRVGDPFVINVKVKNVSDKPTNVYYQTIYQAQQLSITNEKGEVVKAQQTAMYEMPHPKEFFHRLDPGETYAAQMKGRVEMKFLRAKELPANDSDRPLLMDFHDVAQCIERPGRFTAALRLKADEKTAQQGKGLGFDPVWTGDVQSNSIDFAVRLMRREELDKVIARLRAGGEEEVGEAIAVLAANADRQAVPELMAILTAGRPAHLRAASDALVRIQDASVLPDLHTLYQLLVKYRKAEAGELQSILLQTIRGLEPDRQKLTALLIDALKSDASVEARCTAVWELITCNDPQAATALLEAARKPEPRMQWAALDALGSLAWRLPTDEAREELAASLAAIMKNDPEGSVRQRAVGALAATNSKSVVPALLEALKDPDRFVGAMAAHWLGTKAGPEAIPALEEYLKSAETDGQKSQAQDAIKFIRQRAAPTRPDN